MTYEISVDGEAARLSIDGSSLRYERENGASIDRGFSIVATGRGVSSILIDGRSYTVSLLGEGQVSVNGRVFRVEVFDPRNMRGRKTAAVSGGPLAVAAPMPGRVIRILVEAGDAVELGQGLIVVEAMKMQNEMNSLRAGRVAEVRVAAGATVSAGEVLIVIE